jgi:hypothetical protein
MARGEKYGDFIFASGHRGEGRLADLHELLACTFQAPMQQSPTAGIIKSVAGPTAVTQ